MCDFCKNYNAKPSELELGDIIIVASARYTFIGDGHEHGIPMNFCPNCGEKIKELFVCGLVFMLLCVAWTVEKFDKTGLSAFDDYCDDWYGGEE